jgi:hypothetical protein
MVIGKSTIETSAGEVVFRTPVDTSMGRNDLWFSVPKEFGDFVSPTSDAPLTAMIIPAMKTGEDVHVEGPISEKLWFNLSSGFQHIVRRIIPSLKPVQIIPAEVIGNAERADGVATGFSRGIDSWCTLCDYHFEEGPAGVRVTHLLFNNVGSHGLGGERLYHGRLEGVRSTAERLDLPLIPTNSNMDFFYDRHETKFRTTVTVRNMASAMVVQRGIGRLLCSSGIPYERIFVGETDIMAFSDPILLPFMSTGRFEGISVGSEYIRVEKTVRVSERPESFDAIDVCLMHQQAGNCCHCWKCLRTLLTFEIAGVLDQYAPSFDLTEYARQRDQYIRSALRSEEPYLAEVVAFAKERDFDFGYRLRAEARILKTLDQLGLTKTTNRAKRLIRRAIRRTRTASRVSF